MIVLFDTDVLIDVATERKPFSTHSSAVLDAAEAHLFVSFIAWHSLSNFYYIVSSTKGNTNAKEFLKDLLKFVQIAPGSTSDAIQATMLDSFTDFEDALQYVAAKASNAEIIVTRNVNHYKKSLIPAQTPEDFLASLDNGAQQP